MKKKLIRVTTIPLSLEKLLGGQMSFMKDFYKVKAVSSDKEKLEEVGKIEGVETHWIDLTRKITPIKDILAVWKMYNFLKKEKPHFIHSHTPKAGMVSMLAGKLAGVPNRLHTVAGLPLLESTGVKRIVLNIVEKITYSCASKVYPNSNALKNIIIANNLAKQNKLKVIGHGSSNGINLDYFNPENFTVQQIDTLKKQIGIKAGQFVYIFVGRIVKDKGINELIESFIKVNLENPNTKLLLVGPFESDLDPIKPENVIKIKENKNIIEVGYVNDVRPYFLISDLLVFPSYREGFPNVVMQAAAMGLPCIVSNINGCNEIIQQNSNGLIVPVKDVENLTLKMKELLLNEALYLKLKTNTRESIKDRYEQKFIWHEILNEYKQLDNV
ncbi:glycosyltransferase family 4 protein [Lacinutrix sp. 5H-3-7-4]|uniref:glycosyltransferase family 4 protein n=1 Tax=Lacinutrix sp. (strain 5H-3-7-4) TaxID=983544 RepID=UPI00020A38AD|nr:glycosyl transferase group 1 [Lacinutrix sp. 5H-3-7-4]